jgi:hypothetical protein
MEVHHHSHTEGKRLKHYLFEFFMLFLAVFCGFLAENWREHIVESKKEKQYIISLIRDVELDIESLKQSMNAREKYIVYYDSLVLLLKKTDKSNMNDIYYYSRFLIRMNQFNYHDRTIAQLKSSGSLRLIRNKQAADSITIYDNEQIRAVLNQQALELQFRNNILTNNVGRIFDAQVWNDMTGDITGISRPTGNLNLITNDPATINDFIIQVVTLKTAYRVANRFISRTLRSAENLIVYLKKEYHLK